MTGLDELDKNILRWLQKECKVCGIAKMARHLCVPDSTIHDRIKKLEKAGYIRDYVALVDPEKLGMGTVAFIKIFVDLNQVKSVAEELSRFPEVAEVYAVAGDCKILIKVRVSDLDNLNKFIEQKIVGLKGVTNYHPIIALRSYKDSPNVEIR